VRFWARSAGSQAVPAGHGVEIVDRAENRLFASPDAANAGLPPDTVASFPLGPDLFPWTVRVSPSGAIHVRGLVRTQVGLFVGILALLVGFIVAGVWTLVHVAMEEMEVGRLKADFAANVSHELRTPLALIRAAADAIGMRKDLDRPRLERYLGIIARQSQRLQDLINTVLAFASIERGERVLPLERGDLAAFVTIFLRDFRLRLDEGGFHLESSVPSDPVPVRLDADSMHLVLANLLENAMKFSGESRRLELRVETDARTAHVRIRDFGIGIAPEDRTRIFDGFYRAERDLVKKTRGTGIGLALVRDVVRLHGGRVEVESELGQGATFTVSLPKLVEPEAGSA
jgi:two-component system phosphate regulon sensor histidine kinase PhoR